MLSLCFKDKHLCFFIDLPNRETQELQLCNLTHGKGTVQMKAGKWLLEYLPALLTLLLSALLISVVTDKGEGCKHTYQKLMSTTENQQL